MKNDFSYPKSFGFTGSAGDIRVRQHFRKGGSVHSDAAQDKPMVRAALHKHERNLHPGKPLTKMRKGGKCEV